MGLTVLGAHQIATDLVARPGAVAGPAPRPPHLVDAKAALRAARAIGALDIGQAAVSVGERVVALEAAEGRYAIIRRVGELRARGALQNGRAGAASSPSAPARAGPARRYADDRPRTLELVAEVGLAGVSSEAERVMVADRAASIRSLRAPGTFVHALAPSCADAMSVLPGLRCSPLSSRARSRATSGQRADAGIVGRLNGPRSVSRRRRKPHAGRRMQSLFAMVSLPCTGSPRSSALAKADAPAGQTAAKRSDATARRRGSGGRAGVQRRWRGAWRASDPSVPIVDYVSPDRMGAQRVAGRRMAPTSTRSAILRSSRRCTRTRWAACVLLAIHCWIPRDLARRQVNGRRWDHVPTLLVLPAPPVGDRRLHAAFGAVALIKALSPTSSLSCQPCRACCSNRGGMASWRF